MSDRKEPATPPPPLPPPLSGGGRNNFPSSRSTGAIGGGSGAGSGSALPPSAMELRLQEKQEEDRMLDVLHKSVLQTRDAAVNIGEELGEQDVLLNRLDHNVSIATGEANRQTKSIGTLIEESGNCGFYVTVVGLVLIIIILLAI